jgi:hypothetical protein
MLVERVVVGEVEGHEIPQVAPGPQEVLEGHHIGRR